MFGDPDTSDARQQEDLFDLQQAFRASALIGQAADDQARQKIIDNATRFLSDPTAERATRVAVYRNNTTLSLKEVLSHAFPACARQVGTDNFMMLAGRYVHAHPPTVPILAQYGETFADFLVTDPDIKTHAPYLPDLARLEWCLHHAYFAADAPPLDPQVLAAMAPDALANACFVKHPAAHLLSCEWPVLDFLEADAPILPEECETERQTAHILVSRPALQVSSQAISGTTAHFLALLFEGKPLAEAAEADPANVEAMLVTALQSGCLTKPST